MDIDKIVAEVLRRLEDKTESREDIHGDEDKREKVLIISREESRGHFLSEKMDTLHNDYKIDCVTGGEVAEDYTTVILEGLDDTGLGKMASGIFDEAYLESVHQALIQGREVLLDRDTLEIYSHRHSVPAGLFSFYQEKLESLERWGIKALTADGIVNNLKSRRSNNSQSREVYGKNLMKRVVTDRDIRETLEEGHKTVTVLPTTMITDIARETAEKKGVDIVVCKE